MKSIYERHSKKNINNNKKSKITSGMQRELASALMQVEQDAVTKRKAKETYEARRQADKRVQATTRAKELVKMMSNKDLTSQMILKIAKDIYTLTRTNEGKECCIDVKAPTALVSLFGENAIMENEDISKYNSSEQI
jgi:hypothetical protein